MRLCRKIVPLFLFISLCWFTSPAAKGPVVINVDIPAGTWKVARLKNLPEGAVVALEVKSSATIIAALVDTNGYHQYPDVSRPLFAGQVDGKLSFSVTIPHTDNYYVVLDNRSGSTSRAVTVTVRAARGKTDQVEAADRILRTFERQLHQLFVFDPFPMRVKPCGRPKAFVGTAGITLCTEYVQLLYDSFGDRQKAQAAFSFSIFHELSRVLLTQWQHPSSAKITAVDEFAAVLMVMLNQKERLISAAENSVINPSDAAALMKRLRDDRHPLSEQRARKILRRLKDPQYVSNWQNFLVPHMQTKLLQKLAQQPTAWTDLPLVKKELFKRRGKPPLPSDRVSPGKGAEEI